LVGVPGGAGQGIIACDFFCVESVWLRTLYVLVFIELHTRRVFVTASTAHPDSAWVTQQARNLSMDLDGRAPVRFLIHDRDSKFSGSFDECFRSEGTEVILTPSALRTRTPSPSDGSEPSGRSAWTGCSSSDAGISTACSGPTWSTTTAIARIGRSDSLPRWTTPRIRWRAPLGRSVGGTCSAG
jgi:hypothetical protein